MNGFSRRSRHPRIVFLPWIWLLSTIFSICCPVEASARESLCRADELLSASMATVALAAPTVKPPPAKDPHPAPSSPVCLAGDAVKFSVCNCRTRQAGELNLRHSFATGPAPALPRPPPFG